MRRFTPKKFFLSLLHLTSGTNSQGYTRALRKAWQDIGSRQAEPVKSSLCKMRKRISYKFFEEKFHQFVSGAKAERKTFRGLYVYAIDGQESVLPLSEELLQKGYVGRARLNGMETYYPRIYFSQAFDVINEMSLAVTHSNRRNENRDAIELLGRLEQNSIVLYDRAYLSKGVLNAHLKKGNYFVFRCPSGATFREVISFYKSSRRQAVWEYNGVFIRLIKIKNPRTKEDIVLATNLSNSQMNNKQLAGLYCRRWGIETAFRDSVSQALEQWHSKTENGILQELYCHLWLMNFARLQLVVQNPNKAIDWLEDLTYKKSNLKLLVELIVDCVPLILKQRLRQAIRLITRHIQRTLETRERLKRSYDRVRKYSHKSFPFNNLVKRRK